MRRGIHPIKHNVNIITTINNSYKLSFIYNIKRFKLEIDPYSHIIFNKLLNVNTIKQEKTLNRLRLFKIKK